MVKPSTDFRPASHQVQGLYQHLLSAYGAQQWWPAESAFEVAVGAVLTQNTNWTNVEKALVNLRSAEALDLAVLLSLSHEALAELIRPAGYYRLKAKRLRNLCVFLDQVGGLEGLATLPLGDAREGLLAVNGVGPETADDILLYALDRPVFVIDTYTRRLLARWQLASGEESYEALRLGMQDALAGDAEQYAQYHALIVQHAKAACAKVPRCHECALAIACPSADLLPA